MVYHRIRNSKIYMCRVFVFCDIIFLLRISPSKWWPDAKTVRRTRTRDNWEQISPRNQPDQANMNTKRKKVARPAGVTDGSENTVPVFSLFLYHSVSNENRHITRNARAPPPPPPAISAHSVRRRHRTRFSKTDTGRGRRRLYRRHFP